MPVLLPVHQVRPELPFQREIPYSPFPHLYFHIPDFKFLNSVIGISNIIGTAFLIRFVSAILFCHTVHMFCTNFMQERNVNIFRCPLIAKTNLFLHTLDFSFPA